MTLKISLSENDQSLSEDLFTKQPRRKCQNSDKLDILFNRRKHMVLYIFHVYKTDVSVYWSTITRVAARTKHIHDIHDIQQHPQHCEETHDGAGGISPKHASTSAPVSASCVCPCTVQHSTAQPHTANLCTHKAPMCNPMTLHTTYCTQNTVHCTLYTATLCNNYGPETSNLVQNYGPETCNLVQPTPYCSTSKSGI